jgi:hypothetical protein
LVLILSPISKFHGFSTFGGFYPFFGAAPLGVDPTFVPCSEDLFTTMKKAAKKGVETNISVRCVIVGA